MQGLQVSLSLSLSLKFFFTIELLSAIYILFGALIYLIMLKST